MLIGNAGVLSDFGTTIAQGHEQNDSMQKHTQINL